MEKVEVKIRLDGDAAGMLPSLAGSPRKLGSYLSALIRADASRRSLPADTDRFKLLADEMLGAASQLASVQQTLIQLARDTTDAA